MSALSRSSSSQASSAGTPPSRLVPTNPAYLSACKGGILVNRLHPSAAIPATGSDKLKQTLRAAFTGSAGVSSWREEIPSASSKRSSSPSSFASGSGSARSTSVDSAAAKISFAPLPASGRTRASSVTVGVAARASMLANQQGRKPPGARPPGQGQSPAPQPVPLPPPEPPVQFGGSGDQGLYTVKDVGKGISRGWSKLRGRSNSRDESFKPAPKKGGPLDDVEEDREGEKTPRRRSSITNQLSPVTSNVDDNTGALRKATSMGLPSGHSDPSARSSHDVAVFGYDPRAIRDALLGSDDGDRRGRSDDRTPSQSRGASPKRRGGDEDEDVYDREVWRGPAHEDAASSTGSTGDEDTADDDEEEGFESASETTTDDGKDEGHARSTLAAGVEIFEHRHR